MRQRQICRPRRHILVLELVDHGAPTGRQRVDAANKTRKGRVEDFVDRHGSDPSPFESPKGANEDRGIFAENQPWPRDNKAERPP